MIACVEIKPSLGTLVSWNPKDQRITPSRTEEIKTLSQLVCMLKPMVLQHLRQELIGILTNAS
jgi:hypothetical protein